MSVLQFPRSANVGLCNRAAQRPHSATSSRRSGVNDYGTDPVMIERELARASGSSLGRFANLRDGGNLDYETQAQRAMLAMSKASLGAVVLLGVALIAAQFAKHLFN